VKLGNLALLHISIKGGTVKRAIACSVIWAGILFGFGTSFAHLKSSLVTYYPLDIDARDESGSRNDGTV
jgi:hypothetical protein